VFALRLNSQITRTVGDQLFLLPPWTPSRRLWAGAASGGGGLPNFIPRPRRSLRVTDSPAPAHRRAREARKLRQPVKKSLQKPGITPKSPTDCGTDPDFVVQPLNGTVGESMDKEGQDVVNMGLAQASDFLDRL